MIASHLNTAHLQLRPFSADDTGAVLAYWQSDPGWERFNASIPSNFMASDAANFVAEMRERDRHHRPHWAIVHEGSVVGVVSLTFEQDRRIAVIGYGIHADLRGRGLSVEAASKIIGEAFVSYSELVRIRAHTDAENEPSMRVLEKLGFVQEGILRKNQFVKGRFVDEAI
jgi:ribosomal-protein-alanine N-acetyltransferase